MMPRLHAVATEMALAAITDRQFYEALQALGAQLERKINERADAIEKKLDEHAADDRDLFTAISNRVLVIETQRGEEKDQAVKRGSLFALIGAGGMTLAISAVRKFFSI